MEFKPLSYLEDAVKSKNIKDIRRSLRSYIKKCLGDTNEIMDALNYVKKSLSEEEYKLIWEEYDGIILEFDKNKWNKDYFAAVEVDLSDNFSKERFNHILEVGRYVYGTTKPCKQDINTSQIKTSKPNGGKQNFLPIIIVGGGIVLLLGAVMLSKLMKK